MMSIGRLFRPIISTIGLSNSCAIVL